jgi:glucose/arabinose dehydrogenase
MNIGHMPRRCRLLLSLGVPLAGAISVSAAVRTQLVVDGLSRPVQAIAPPGDFERLFVIEQHTGHIKIIRNGAVAGIFLSIGSLSTGGEQGLLGLAFHPDYAANGRLYVSYTGGGNSIVAEYLRSASNPDLADVGSRRPLLTQSQPFANHNGGQILFGPDGYLYIGFGDGGSGGDPQGNAQFDGTFLGKMLRIDVDGVDPGKQYRVPPTNPHYGAGDPLDEIWAKGLRNPWRFSFDRLTGDLYIADVGQNCWEEVNFEPAGSGGGWNYGWDTVEGYACFNESNFNDCADVPPPDCDKSGLAAPVHVYSHGAGCSVTGGFVYRGYQIPEASGRYFFADYCSARFFSFVINNDAATDVQEHTADLAPGGGRTLNGITAFGQDALGELYICDIGNGQAGQGELYKIVRDVPLPDGDGDGIPDSADNCPDDPNPTQDNLDGDGLGDLCDPDDDDDGRADEEDNCPVIHNPDQADSDQDGTGDACDECPGTPAGVATRSNGCPRPILGDFDGDGDVDMSDFGYLQRCYTGSGSAAVPECAAAQLDEDADVDQNDFGLFQACISGANRPVPPECILP